MKKFLKYGLIVLFAALTLVGITLLMNKVNSTEGTSNYYRSKYNENYNNAVAMLSDKNESLKNRYDAFMSVYKNTEEALTLKSKKDLTKEQKILTKIYTKEKLEKVIDDAFVALENIKTTEEYNYNYGVNKNGASEPNFAEASSYIALYQEFESKVKDAEKYETSSDEYEDYIEQVKSDIEKITEIENPKWYILDRNSNSGYVSFIQDTKSIENISKVFPVVFFIFVSFIFNI